MLRRLIFRSDLSLGDIVVLTAAIRDLHRCYPGQFLTDVRTSCGEVWANNPHLTLLDEASPEVQVLRCEYPLIQWSNQVPYHFLHGFVDHLNAQLGLEIRVTEFRGDIHLSPAERRSSTQLTSLAGGRLPYWLVMAGGKHDVTIKWWSSERYQRVVDHFRGRVQFVQVGRAGDFHPKLQGGIDLRGRTSLRELIRLVHGSQGVLCGVTGLMHLAAAVPIPSNSHGLRPCVVVAGGREPVHWEEYPGHSFLHAVGQLACCSEGGCWRSRTVRLGDGDARDRKINLCVDVRNELPACMDLISAERVIEQVERFLEGRKLRLLSTVTRPRAERAIRKTQENPVELEALTAQNVRPRMEWIRRRLTSYAGEGRGRGVVLCAGGARLFTCAWVAIRMLRRSGCRLPVELWHLGPREMTPEMRDLIQPYGVRCVDALQRVRNNPMRRLGGWELKSFALLHCSFEEVLLLDADNVVARDPTALFDSEPYRKAGAVFWPDNPEYAMKPSAWKLCGLKQMPGRPFESGQVLVNKRHCWKALELACWFNQHSDFFYPLTWGDKETFRLAFRILELPYAMPRRSPRGQMRQYDFEGRVMFQHRNTEKWSLAIEPRRIPGFLGEKQCIQFIEELRRMWNPERRASLRSPKAQVRPNRSIGSAPLTPPIGRRQSSSHSDQARSRSLTVVMLFDQAMAPIGEWTAPEWEGYARRWGYRFICHRESLDPSRPTAWSKVIAVRRALEETRGPVLWVDADVWLMNPNIAADTLLPSRCDAAFATDFNGLNSGAFLMRSTPWSRSFLDAVYFLSDVRSNPDEFGDKWEQNTFKAVHRDFRGSDRRITLLPQRALNSTPATFESGDFVLHLGGMSNRERLQTIRRFRSVVTLVPFCKKWESVPVRGGDVPIRPTLQNCREPAPRGFRLL